MNESFYVQIGEHSIDSTKKLLIKANQSVLFGKQQAKD